MLAHTEPAIIAIISFGSNNWTQNIITSFWKLLPQVPILVVDNNPDAGEEGYAKSYFTRKFTNNPMVEAERFWLDIYRERLHLVKQPNRHDLSHGAGIDCAKTWCLEHNYTYMTHIEPDCVFSDNNWYFDQIVAVHNGALIAGCFRAGAWGYRGHERPADNLLSTISEMSPIQVCCATYNIKSLAQHSFKASGKRTSDIHEPEYQRLVTPYYGYDWNDSNTNTSYPLWDTGHEIWYQAVKIGYCKKTCAYTLRHIGNSSLRDYWTREAYPSHI